jgi:hypothetical protein
MHFNGAVLLSDTVQYFLQMHASAFSIRNICAKILSVAADRNKI